MERITQSKVIKFYKEVWNNHNEQDATWEQGDYLREVIPLFMKNGRSFKSWDKISIRGRGCNTPVLSIAFGICIL